VVSNIDSVVDSDRVGRGLLGKILRNVGHGDVVEGDASDLTLTVEVRVPELDVALLQVSEAGKLNRSSALAGEVHGSLHHVARSAAIPRAGAVAVLGNGGEPMRRVETDATGAVHRTLKLRQVVRTREGLLGASRSKLISSISVEVGEEETGSTEGRLLHDGRVAKLLHQSLATLDGSVGDLGSLGRTICSPGTTLEAVDEGDHATYVGEVDEGIAHVAAGLEVDAKVEEIVGAKADFVEDSLERHLQWSSV